MRNKLGCKTVVPNDEDVALTLELRRRRVGNALQGDDLLTGDQARRLQGSAHPALDHLLRQRRRIHAPGGRDIADAPDLDSVVHRHDDAILLGIVNQVDVGHLADLEPVQGHVGADREAGDGAREV